MVDRRAFVTSPGESEACEKYVFISMLARLYMKCLQETHEHRMSLIAHYERFILAAQLW